MCTYNHCMSWTWFCFLNFSFWGYIYPNFAFFALRDFQCSFFRVNVANFSAVWKSTKQLIFPSLETKVRYIVSKKKSLNQVKKSKAHFDHNKYFEITYLIAFSRICIVFDSKIKDQKIELSVPVWWKVWYMTRKETYDWRLVWWRALACDSFANNFTLVSNHLFSSLAYNILLLNAGVKVNNAHNHK